MTTDPTAALARIRQMADYWEQRLPEVIRTPAVVSALRAALEPVVPVASPPADRAVSGAARRERWEARFRGYDAYDYADLATIGMAVADEERAALPEPADRDAEAEAPLSPDYQHPECGFHWHSRDGMDIPMRNGQPVCPRCELRTVERRLLISERRRDELREESLRRGKAVGEYSEKVRLLEREIDGVRRQLGAEILRANTAEDELRRLADETPAAPPKVPPMDPVHILGIGADEPQQDGARP